MPKGLDNVAGKAKIPPISRISRRRSAPGVSARVYDLNPAVATSEKRRQMNQCKHPRVRIVSRDADSEFVECLECGEIFESSEFKDMTIEETKLNNES